MIFTPFEDKHLKEVERINSHRFHQYDLNQPFVLRGVVFDKDGKMVGFGGLKTIYEVVLILDYDSPKKDRVIATRELMKAGVIKSDEMKIKHWHAFCDPEFAMMLERWFGFKPSIGTPLVLEL